MKQLFFIGVIVALASCGGTETDTTIVPTSDTLQSDTAGVDTPFNTDSIETVGELLDSLAAVEPAAKMTH
tara:strand:+ start:174 stop:383 length:210 start_codon:yes stop_codon:yes gene_type:complete